MLYDFSRLIPMLLGAGVVALATPCMAAPKHLIIIAMENSNSVKAAPGDHRYIYGNPNAPYINDELWGIAARSSNFSDNSDASRSQPHYIQMLAGRSRFHDADFTCNNDPLRPCHDSAMSQNWTTSSGHLMAQIDAAKDPALTWMTYQESLDVAKTGACPINSYGLYAAKHNPFVYFADISGNPPSEDNDYCIAHTRPLHRFMTDMQAGDLANYVFITPNLCNDMHGDPSCPKNSIAHGDSFLRKFLPPVLEWANKNDAVVFVVWDESNGSRSMPFFAAGSGVKQGYEGSVEYSHSSVLRTVERIFNLPPLDAVRDENDLADLFEPGVLP